MTEMLGHVLSPFPEDRRNAMISWVEREMETRPLIDNLTSDDGVNWVLGEPSPGNPGAVIFAMLYHEPIRGVVIYSVSMTPADGGQTAFEYFRETCFNPRHVHGPISGDALFLDLHEFVAVDMTPEDKGRGLNGDGAGVTQ
jgi:hypothetical protein